MCQVDQILVKNALSNKKDIKYAKIQAKFGRELKWAQTVGSPLLLLQANRFKKFLNKKIKKKSGIGW